MRQPADPLLVDLLDHWDGYLKAVVAFIDGWEELLDQRPWDESIRTRFQDGHAAAFEALARLGAHPDHAVQTTAHAREWGRAKLAVIEPGLERESMPALPSLPKDLRAVAIIGGLSRRAILRGGKPLFGDRLSPLVGLRLGIFGT